MSLKLNSKQLTFVAIMAALGNVLTFISIQLAPIAPNIPMTNISVAFDLSHIASFVTAFFGGPLAGGLAGLLGGLVSAFEFGFSKGYVETGLLLPLAKGITGLTAGLIFSRINMDNKRYIMVVSTVLSYIPEGIITYLIFIYMYPALYGMPDFIASAVASSILMKAFVEMVVLGLLMMWITANKAFTEYTKSQFN